MAEAMSLVPLWLPVVVLDHGAHGPDGGQVLIVALGVDEVEGLGGPGVPVGGCEVYGYLKRGCG